MAIRTPVLAIWLLVTLAPASDEPQPTGPCLIPKGPPCVPANDPRLKDPSCTFEKGACFAVRWDSYQGDSIIEAAEVIITPRCDEETSYAVLEKKGREYLSGMQTVPVDVTVVANPCEAKGHVDVKVTKSRAATPPLDQ